MGKRTLVLAVALILAAVSAFSVWQYLSSIEDDVRRDIQEVRVFRATEPIEVGTPLAEAELVIEESIALRETVEPADGRPTLILCVGELAREGEEADLDVCSDQKDFDSLQDGSVAAGPIARGQLITEDMFIPPQELNSKTLSESIPQGKVAISFRPSEDSAVGGFIRPGDKVNMLASVTVDLSNIAFTALLTDPELRELVLGSAEPPTDTGGDAVDGEPTAGEQIGAAANVFNSRVQFTQTVLQNLEVLAIGADTRDAKLGTGLEPQGTQIVVLEVTPQQAELIEYAKQYTTVSLSLLPDPKLFPYTEFEARGAFVDDLFDLVPRIQELLEPVEELLGN